MNDYVRTILREASSDELQALHDGLHDLGFVEHGIRPEPQAAGKKRPKPRPPNPCKPGIPAGRPPELARRELVTTA